MAKYIFLIFYFKLSFAWSFYEVLNKVENINSFYIIDMRGRSGNETEFFENSVHFEWQQLSQLGLPSRGYLKKNLDALAQDLSELGIHPDKSLIIIGRGLRGRGEEGRVAYTLTKLGFDKVFISTGSYLKNKGFKIKAKAPPHILKSALFKAKVKTDLEISREEMKLLLKDNKRRVSCLDVRPENNAEQLFNLKYFCRKINWKSFFNKSLNIDPLIAASLTENGFAKTDKIIVLSEAGLSSPGVTLALRQLGFKNAVVFEGGYSDLRALMLDTNIFSTNH